MRYLLIVVFLVLPGFPVNAGIYARITTTDETATDKLEVHQFSAAIRLYLRGVGNLSQLATAYDLDQSEQNQVTEMKTDYDALGTDVAKQEYREDLHNVMLLWETGDLTKTQGLNILGFTE